MDAYPSRILQNDKPINPRRKQACPPSPKKSIIKTRQIVIATEGEHIVKS